MKKKIVGIFVCTLLLATALPLATAIENNKDNKLSNNFNQESGKPRQIIDQKQEICQDCRYVDNYAWQEFVPQGNKLLGVELCIAQWFTGSPDLKITIEKPLTNVLTTAVLTVSEVPEDTCDWVSINLPPITLTKGATYYIVVKYDPGGEYGWCGADNNPYLPGQSDQGPTWDWTFRTIVDKSRPKGLNSPFLNFLENHPSILLILKILLNQF